MNIHALRYLTPLALTVGLAACGHKAASAIDTTDNTVVTSDAAGNATVAGGNAADDMMAATPTAQQFADMAAKSDAFEIAAARLAATHGASADVKAYATKMIAAHGDSTLKIKNAAAAAAPAITPDATPTNDQTDQLTALGKLNGQAFDKAYVAGQVTAHNHALSLMQLYADKGDAPTLKAAAGEIVPVVEGHLAMAKAMAGK